MLLAIDIGNTHISLGLVKKGKVKGLYHVETTLAAAALKSQLHKALQFIAKKFPAIEDVIVCSVVPPALKATESAVKKVFGNTPLVIGRDVKVPIVNRYRNPKQVGQDRLVCAYAAMRLYGFPVIVVDLGTAITLELVSAKQEYWGGIIVPGIKMSTESLYQKTALLPRTTIRRPRDIIGQDTESSILSGIFYGYGAMIRGLVALVREKHKMRPKVVVTGGYTQIMRQYIEKNIDVIDTDLVFRGMELIWQELCHCSCSHCD